MFSDQIEQNPFELQAFCNFFKNQKFLFTLCHPIVLKLSYISYQLHSTFPNNSKVDAEMFGPIYIYMKLHNFTLALFMMFVTFRRLLAGAELVEGRYSQPPFNKERNM